MDSEFQPVGAFIRDNGLFLQPVTGDTRGAKQLLALD